MTAVDATLLAGPTASGKSELVLALAARVPIEIVSVDSSQVYRGFDIGAAKPDRAIRARVPHHLIDIRDPQQNYSAGEFVADALAAIKDIRSRNRMPVLVGGTMLYFSALVRGIAPLPTADPQTRAQIDARAARLGWPALHAELAAIDLEAAQRIHPNDPQRIQRALEVYAISGRSISDWQRATQPPTAGLSLARYALVPTDRALLQLRIAQRFERMMVAGFLAEVEALRARQDLPRGAASLRAVGYRQLMSYLEGDGSLEEAVQRAVAASRQLAKRQLTWINADPGWQRLEPFDRHALAHWVDEMVFVCGASLCGTLGVVDCHLPGERPRGNPG